jgi:hypothetical protein
MATFKNVGTGNFTTAANWAVVKDFENTETAAQQLTTTAVASANYTAGVGETVDGLLVKFANVNGTAGQIAATTITAELYNVTTTTIVGTQTINTADLQFGTLGVNCNGCWTYFKFGATIALTALQNYAVRLKVNAGGANVQAWRAGANAWNRGIVITTTGTPAAADILIVTGELTGAGTNTPKTVTMDNTAATSWGNIYVGNAGTLNWGTAASTNYYLKLAGLFYVGFGGIYQMGTSGTPVPSTSTAILEFACASSGQYGMICYSTTTTYGAAKTTKAKLAANAAIGATSITTDVSTSWASGDILGVAGTTRTATDGEKVTMSGAAVGTTVPISALVVAHSGTAPTQADIINLRRNVRIIGNSTTNVTYINFPSGLATSISLNYTEIYFCGTLTSGKYGLGWANTGGSFEMKYCSMYDAPSGYAFWHGVSSNGTISMVDNVFYNLNQSVIFSTSTTSTWSIDTMVAIRAPILLNDIGGTFKNVTSANTSTGINITETNGVLVTYDNLTAYGCSSIGISIGRASGTITNLTAWRTNGTNLNLAVINQQQENVVIDTFTLFGALSFNIQVAGNIGLVTLKNGSVTGGTTLVCQYGLNSNGLNDAVQLYNVSMSGHSISDLLAGQSQAGNITLIGCTLASSSEVTSQSSQTINYEMYGMSSLNHNGVAGSNKTWQKNGTIQTDSTIFNTASPSIRLIPTTASYKLAQKPLKVAVASGQTCAIGVYVRKSVLADGTAYNGNQPRLMVRQNLLAGITADTVLATMTVAGGTWEQLSGTTAAVAANCVLEFYVDCDGTLGWVNVDDFNTTTNVNTKGTGYWDFGQPFIIPYFSGQKSSTFVQ